ncbi:MAG: hypothetical protein K2K20_09210, partial [Lachnospiraceae bacterium]|nr:hypothetical protein [Lachnospiraceae bacterium]
MAKQRKWHLKPEVKGILIFVLVLFSLMTAVTIYHLKTVFIFEDNLAEPIVTIDETVITLKEISYYI